jgi:hypothetical protein
VATVTPSYIEFERLQLDIVNTYYRRNDPLILSAMRRRSPVDTGLMRSRHVSRPPRRTGGGWVIKYVAEVPYSVYVHQGVGEHVRRVRNVIGGGKLRASVISYTHPGQRAQPWMYEAMRGLGFDATWKRGRNAS